MFEDVLESLLNTTRVMCLPSVSETPLSPVSPVSVLGQGTVSGRVGPGGGEGARHWVRGRDPQDESTQGVRLK